MWLPLVRHDRHDVTWHHIQNLAAPQKQPYENHTITYTQTHTQTSPRILPSSTNMGVINDGIYMNIWKRDDNELVTSGQTFLSQLASILHLASHVISQ